MINTKNNWLKTGLIWGAFMFVIMTFIYPYFDGQEITWLRVGVGLVVWTLCGIGFGFAMKNSSNKAINKRGENTKS